MPTNDQAQQTYLDARRALNNIARSLKATQEQVDAARAARTRLSTEFIGARIEEVEARTAQFRRFIEVMEQAIRAVGRGSPIRALTTLREVVDGARNLLEEPE